MEEVVFNPWETAVDGIFGDGVAAFLDSALDSGPRFVRVGKPEEVEDDAEAVLLGLFKGMAEEGYDDRVARVMAGTGKLILNLLPRAKA